MPVATFNPAAGANSPVDGWLYKDGTSWADGHDAATAGIALTTDSSSFIARADGGSHRFGRGVLCFDTSSLSGSTINSAYITIYGNGTASANADSESVNVVSVTLAGTDNLVVGDYDGFGTTVFSAKTIASYSATNGAANDFTLNASGLSHINTSGVTCFGFRIAGDVTDTPTSGNNRISAYYADSAGAYVPVLTVDYTAGGGGPTRRVFHIS